MRFILLMLLCLLPMTATAKTYIPVEQCLPIEQRLPELSDRGVFSMGINAAGQLLDEVARADQDPRLIWCNAPEDPIFSMTGRVWGNYYLSNTGRLFASYDWDTDEVDNGAFRGGLMYDLYGGQKYRTRLSLYGGGQWLVGEASAMTGMVGASGDHILVSRLSMFSEAEYVFGDRSALDDGEGFKHGDYVAVRAGLSARLF